MGKKYLKNEYRMKFIKVLSIRRCLFDDDIIIIMSLDRGEVQT